MSSDFMRARVSQEFEDILRDMMTLHVYPKGATIFRQGTPVGGLYLIETGEVRVLLATADSNNQLLEVVGSGCLLGLSDSMAGGNYRVTAEASEPTSAAFLEREVFLQFLSSHQEFCMQVIRTLSDSLHRLYHKFRDVSAQPGRPRRRSPNDLLS
ncbi:MAG: Crp/Fnr family transcriptional regulator [Terriglobales bacterium]